ncbi:hypothetical protein [Psychrobacillus psychrodurans]|uniref:Uncharacterized protein n=1 Tax=Psychrobacillus psychrodurans TaxID=126157 RepID=A0A9X3LB89_9BACI|nr:hypothetical protein [Psychrobacillus psychrodurans]MCZ8533541.1 hypothetical protein [Psychrobacillus psychrodurans]
MSIKPNGVSLTFEGVAKSDKGRLIGIRPWVDFSTKVQIGYTYEILLEGNGFEKIQVKVENHPAILTEEQLSEMKEPVYVICENFSAKFYMSDRTKNYELTCKADKLSIVRQIAKS